VSNKPKPSDQNQPRPERPLLNKIADKKPAAPKPPTAKPPGLQRVSIEGLKKGPNKDTKIEIEPGSTWVNTESNKQYTVLSIGAGIVEIQGVTEPDVKFKVRLDRFLQKYKAVDVNELVNIFTPDPEKFTFDKMILWPDCVESIHIGVRRITRWEDLERIWTLSKLDGRRMILNFFGEPGTGKTMAAKCIATLLNKKMVQADYAKMISKWHGDTGKHIKTAFELAKKNDAILFLDEADSLVSARVNLSSERMSIATAINSDRNVFMQELDGFDGIVIMTTNFYGNYDKAIIRRVAQHVRFKLPNRSMRIAIYKEHITNPARCREIDWMSIGDASKSFSGGDIKNAVLNGIILSSESENTDEWWLTTENLMKETKKVGEAKKEHGEGGQKRFSLPASLPKTDVIRDDKGGPAPTTPPSPETIGPAGITKKEWDEITYPDGGLERAIRRYLLTPAQAKQLMERDYSIEMVLEGRFPASDEPFINTLLEEWNTKLGWKSFGFNVTAAELVGEAHRLMEQAVGGPVDIKFSDPNESQSNDNQPPAPPSES
jgi:hypothetical protein